MLTEADLDLELELEEGHGHGHGRGGGGGGLDDHVADQFGHGHSHSMRGFRATASVTGSTRTSSGGWFNAGHAQNLFGGTGFGRRIVPATARRVSGAGSTARSASPARTRAQSSSRRPLSIHRAPRRRPTHALRLCLVRPLHRHPGAHAETAAQTQGARNDRGRFELRGRKGSRGPLAHLRVRSARGVGRGRHHRRRVVRDLRARRRRRGAAEPKGVDGRAVVFTALGVWSWTSPYSGCSTGRAARTRTRTGTRTAPGS